MIISDSKGHAKFLTFITIIMLLFDLGCFSFYQFGTSPIVIAPSMKLSSSGFNPPAEEEGSSRSSFFDSLFCANCFVLCCFPCSHFLKVSYLLSFPWFVGQVVFFVLVVLFVFAWISSKRVIFFILSRKDFHVDPRLIFLSFPYFVSTSKQQKMVF